MDVVLLSRIQFVATIMFHRLQAYRRHSLPVVDEGRLVGILAMDNVGEFVGIQSALKQSHRPSRPIAEPRSSST